MGCFPDIPFDIHTQKLSNKSLLRVSSKKEVFAGAIFGKMLCCLRDQ